MISRCPLCGAPEVTLVEAIASSDLVSCYKKALGIDIGTEFRAVDLVHLCHCHGCDLRFFHPSVIGSQAFYRELQKQAWYYLDDKAEYQVAKQFIQSDHAVLEVGCGKGAFAKLLSAKSFYGLELSPDAIAMANGEGIMVSGESVRQHALRNPEQYDVVCAFQVLEHVEDIHDFIASSLGCLKGGGLLIYSVPSADSFAADVPNFFLDMPPHHNSRWSDRSLNALAGVFNLDLVNIYHEQIQPEHRHSYRFAAIYKYVHKFLGRSQKLMDRTFANRLLIFLSNSLACFPLKTDKQPPLGLTVTAVYRKRS